MENIKVAITNLGKYNEGELVYEWLELPADNEEIAEVMRNIGICDEYEEHFISDYEAPLSIEVGEYESLSKLNEMAEQLELADIPDAILNGDYDAGDVMTYADELECSGLVPSATEHIADIISEESLNEMVAHQAQDGGWQRVACFLSGIDYMNDDYYYINGYGNAENLDHGTLEAIVSDLTAELLSEIS